MALVLTCPTIQTASRRWVLAVRAFNDCTALTSTISNTRLYPRRHDGGMRVEQVPGARSAQHPRQGRMCPRSTASLTAGKAGALATSHSCLFLQRRDQGPRRTRCYGVCRPLRTLVFAEAVGPTCGFNSRACLICSGPVTSGLARWRPSLGAQAYLPALWPTASAWFVATEPVAGLRRGTDAL